MKLRIAIGIITSFAFYSFYFFLAWGLPFSQASTTAHSLQQAMPDIVIEADKLIFNERIITLTEPLIITPAGDPALLLKDIILLFEAEPHLSNDRSIILQLKNQSPIYFSNYYYGQLNTARLGNDDYESLVYLSLPVICDGSNYHWERKEKLNTVAIYSADYWNVITNPAPEPEPEEVVVIAPPSSPWGTIENGSYFAQLWPHADIAAGYYTTLFDRSPNRVINIQLACDFINGTVIAPGETFSFNQTVGARSTSRGFRVAKIFHKDEIIDGIGGGICQVSSTLYNCVISASLELLERHRHSLRVNYVPNQQDATVSWGSLDFRFANNTDKTIVLFSQVYEKYVAVIMVNFE